jgi:hypothetical protein
LAAAAERDVHCVRYCSNTRRAVGWLLVFSNVIPACAEAGRRDRVSVALVEEVIRGVVEVWNRASVELPAHGGPVEVVDPVHRRVGRLVVDGVRVGRKEVAGLIAHLMRVDEEHGRIPADRLELAIGLRLRAGEPVPVEVEAIGVSTGVGFAPVGILDGQDHDDRLIEDLRRGAVRAVRQLPEDAQGGVGATLLAVVHVAGDPEDGRVLLRDGPDVARTGRRIINCAADARMSDRPC